MKLLLVTGAAGYIGFHASLALLDRCDWRCARPRFLPAPNRIYNIGNSKPVRVTDFIACERDP